MPTEQEEKFQEYEARENTRTEEALAALAADPGAVNQDQVGRLLRRAVHAEYYYHKAQAYLLGELWKGIALLRRAQSILLENTPQPSNLLTEMTDYLKPYEPPAEPKTPEEQLAEARAILKQVVRNGASDYDEDGRATAEAAEAFLAQYPEEASNGK